ncbi:hypothetical protein HZZ00_11195 [Streptomyces sp. NEAU-sy36]|nr:hypothetical protein HZZ00_11195 [Streptomyces sp. NEAU-sy36]
MQPETPAGGQPEQPVELAETGPETPTDPWADPERARREIEKLRREAAGHRTKVRELEPLAKRAKELEDAQKTAEQRAVEAQQAAEKRAAAAATRAVRAEVRALAADGFADPDDAAGALDLGSYVDDSGDIDIERIRGDLDDLLKRKPHWAKAPAGPRRPAPDPAQGSSGNRRSQTTPADAFAGFLSDALKGRH